MATSRSAPRKPPQARANGGSNAGKRFTTFWHSTVAVSLCAAAVAFFVSAPHKDSQQQDSATGEWQSVTKRLGEPSPTETDVAGACEASRVLWQTDYRKGLDCVTFMRDFWERQPLLSQPGAAWNQGLMTLGDVSKMIGSWPIRFFKNHATVSMHKPNSGFQADFRWQRGEMVPTNAVDVAIAEQRTLVMHNLEVYWPPVGRFIHNVVRYFHAYTQVNLYISPAGLGVATAPHQDAHSVFIIQTHGAKRWCVHAPRMALTMKAFQRGKHGEVIPSSDRAIMGPPVINVTLHPGQVLYIPRGFFHHTATEQALIEAVDVINGEVVPRTKGSDVGAAALVTAGEPSMALTVSILCEDVYNTWLYLLGEALQGLQLLERAADFAEAPAVVASLRRVAKRAEQADESAAGPRLREALPRVLARACTQSSSPTFVAPSAAGWRQYTLQLLETAIREDEIATGRALWAKLPSWLSDARPSAELFASLDAVLARKRIPCDLKRKQIEAMQEALADRPPLTGALVEDVDVDAIFRIEKADRSYLPADRTWFDYKSWT